MALRTTALTPVPLNLDGTFQQPTWGEDNAPYATPATIATGYPLNSPLSSEDVNFFLQQPAEFLRSLMDRSVLSSEGLFTTCVVSQGAWNTLGGTLEITLTPTRIVIDVSQTGGAVLELFATLGDPEVLPALSDSYVDIKDLGTVTVVSVANGAPEPPVTADSARTYLLVTDAAQLTSAALVLGVAPFPCLGPTIGMVNAFIDELAVTGSMSADAIETVTLTTTGLATLAGLQVDGSTTLGEDGTDTLTVLATPTFAEIIDAPAGIRALAATPVDFPEGATMPSNKDFGLGPNGTITGPATASLTLGTVDLIDSTGVLLVGEIRMFEKSPPFSLGSVSFDGRALAMGNGTSAPRIAQPISSFASGPTVEAAAIGDTGAAASLNMRNGESAWIVATMQTQNTVVGASINQQITANAVIIGNSDKIDEPTANVNTSIGWCRVMVYTHAVADATVTFKLRHGAALGVTTSKAMSITATHI